MNEKPLEWMTEGRETSGHMVGRIASLAAAIVLFFASLTSMGLLALVGMVLFAALFAWLQYHAYVEYDYFYLDDEVEIAIVYNRARRKKKLRFNLKDVEYMVKRIDMQGMVHYLCHKGDISNIYTIMLNQNGKRSSVIFEAIPEFVKVMEKKRKLR